MFGNWKFSYFFLHFNIPAGTITAHRGIVSEVETDRKRDDFRYVPFVAPFSELAIEPGGRSTSCGSFCCVLWERDPHGLTAQVEIFCDVL